MMSHWAERSEEARVAEGVAVMWRLVTERLGLAVTLAEVQHSYCSTVQYNTVLCRCSTATAVQYSTVQYSTVQYSTVQVQHSYGVLKTNAVDVMEGGGQALFPNRSD